MQGSGERLCTAAQEEAAQQAWHLQVHLPTPDRVTAKQAVCAGSLLE